MAYTAPVINGWNWFPNRKGLVTGVIVAGFGSGGFIFNRVGSKLINPLGVSSMSFHFGTHDLLFTMLANIKFPYR